MQVVKAFFGGLCGAGALDVEVARGGSRRGDFLMSLALMQEAMSDGWIGRALGQLHHLPAWSNLLHATAPIAVVSRMNRASENALIQSGRALVKAEVTLGLPSLAKVTGK